MKYNSDSRQLYIDKTSVGVHTLLINSLYIVGAGLI
jgi:hypothetical protein